MNELFVVMTEQGLLLAEGKINYQGILQVEQFRTDRAEVVSLKHFYELGTFKKLSDLFNDKVS